MRIALEDCPIARRMRSCAAVVVADARTAEVPDLPKIVGRFLLPRRPLVRHLGIVHFVLFGCAVCCFELVFGCCTCFDIVDIVVVVVVVVVDIVVDIVVVVCIDLVVVGIGFGGSVPFRLHRSSGVVDYRLETSCFCWTLVCWDYYIVVVAFCKLGLCVQHVRK